MSRFVLSLLFGACLLAQSGNLLEEADAAFRGGDFERAATLARRVLALDAGAVHAHMILGLIAARNSDWAVATRHFQAVVRLEPADPHAYFYLGQARLSQQQWQSAIQYFSKALERQYPDRERLLVELSMAQNEAGHPQQAFDTLRKIAVPTGEHLAAQYHSVTAFALDRLGQPGPAIDAIRRALQLEDTSPQNWALLIGLLVQTDQAPQALAEAIRAQRKFPDHPDVQFLFALASYHVSESPLSGLALRNLREADPQSPRVLLAEGLLSRKQAKNQEATEAFRRAAERKVPDAHLLLGIIYKENGDYAAAEREFREAERLTPNHGQVLLELGKVLLNRGELEEARKRLEKAAVLMPDAPGLHYQLGLLYRRLGDAEQAEQHFRQAKQP